MDTAASVVSFEDANFTCLCALRDARAGFFDSLVNAANAYVDKEKVAPLTAQDIDLLRSDEAFQVAEFYYLVRKFELGDPRRVRPFLLRHNDDIVHLIENRERRQAQGLTESRLKDCLFSDIQIEKVVQQISDQRLRLDQADLGRLLGSLVSAETTRKAVVALAKGGLLHRHKIGQVLIVSPGILETLFDDHLRSIVDALHISFRERVQ